MHDIFCEDERSTWFYLLRAETMSTLEQFTENSATHPLSSSIVHASTGPLQNIAPEGLLPLSSFFWLSVYFEK